MNKLRFNNWSDCISCKSILVKTTTCLLLFLLIDITAAEAQRYSVDKEDNSVEWQSMPAPPADGSNPPTPPTPPGEPPAQTPIDGGLGLLLAAGGAYAVRRLRKNEETPTDIT